MALDQEERQQLGSEMTPKKLKQDNIKKGVRKRGAHLGRQVLLLNPPEVLWA